MALKRIPTDEQSLLCASVYINNFKRVIEELVYNSLDAASSSIAIRVCIQENFIQVLDNGNGILEDNFSLLGQKYATNKYFDKTTLKSAPDKYGCRGLSLTSIIDVSQSVKISSRHENSNETWMKTFFNGKEKEIRKTTERPSKGTTVEIKRFLYNLNIQRKSIDPQSELQNIKILLQQLSLMHCNVSFSLRDDFKNDIIFQIHKNRSIQETIQSVFQINEKDVQELQVEKNEYKIQAFIGKNTAESNNYYQWIYINGKFIHKSILHGKLNESLSKSLNTNKRNKNKIFYEDEKNYYNSNIPFYFIFITCPNYDFDVTYNSEKYLIEFKDWKEVNNLIEKLVKFYSGSLVSKKKEVNKVESAIKKKDTRVEIKGIIEKILNNKNKPSRISQLQNGVKGKILKRNKQKKKDLTIKQMLNKKTKSIKDSHSSRKDVLQRQPNNLNASKVLELPKDTRDKVLNSYVLKIRETKKQVPILEKNSIFENSSNMLNNLKNNVISSQIPKKKNTKKQVKTLKKHSVKDSLIKRFEAPTNSMRKRIEYLNQKVLKLLDGNCFKEYSSTQNAVHSFINNETQYQTTTNTKNTANLSLCENMDKNLKHIILPNVYNISGNKNIGYNINDQKIVKTSYDLIKTVMSQYKVTENTNPITHCRQSYERKTNYTYNETCIPMGTYNSHNNNVEPVKKMGYFISETSRNNFFLHERELFPLLKKNTNEVAKLPRNKHKNSKRISNCNLLNRYDQELKEYSYTIEMTDNHETINCNRDVRETFHSIEYNLQMQQDYNNTQSLHFGNKYTLEGNMRSPHQNDTYTLNKIYSLQMCNGSNSYYYLDEIQPSIMQKPIDNESNNGQIEKENLIISESESEQHCKAVLDCHSNELRNLENEFEHSFLHRRADSETYFDFNINNDLQQTENNFESNKNKNISHSIHSINGFKNSKELLDNQDKYIQNITKNQNLSQELQTLQIDSNKIDNDSIYNFLLKSRHRFMPKGMSPIAKNQFKLQSAYSFSGNEIYFKDMIYKNFANDVLINTGIFEPEVHNVKNIFSKHIEKVNIGIQKQNSDLIFDSLSLIRAKILGQLDRKFIASILNGKSAQNGKPSEFLVLFDQHAVDERIRLENNLTDYIQGRGWKSINIDPIPIVLNKDDYLFFVNHNDKLAKFGLQWTFTSENEILINAIPKAILGKNLREVEIVMKAVKKLISEEIKTIKSLRGNISLYPKSIMELVFSEACRYAIKFGDKLSKSECTNMIDSLARCKTPFQCAHGRPVMAVLMELKNNSQTYKINLTKVKKFKKIQ